MTTGSKVRGSFEQPADLAVFSSESQLLSRSPPCCRHPIAAAVSPGLLQITADVGLDAGSSVEVPDGANERLTTHLSNTGSPSPAFNKEECEEGCVCEQAPTASPQKPKAKLSHSEIKFNCSC